MLKVEKRVCFRKHCLISPMFFSFSPSESELILFTRQFAAMLDSGLPILSALDALRDRIDPKKQAGIHAATERIRTRIGEGSSFTGAIESDPRIFPPLYVAFARTGEASGSLAKTMAQMASILEARAQLKKEITSAMAYPAFVSVIAVLITLGLILWVVPILAESLASLDATLPAPTRFFIRLNHFLLHWWGFLPVAAGAIFFGLRGLFKSSPGRVFRRRYQFKIPVIGPLMHKIALARFAETFSCLIQAGVPVLEAMRLVAGTTSDEAVARATLEAAARLECPEGSTLANALATQRVFPASLIQMTATGEEAGKLDEMLAKAAEYWNREIEATVKKLTALINPLLMTVLGIVIGIIVISMALPVFKIYDVLGG